MQERSPLVTRVVVSALMVSLMSSLTATASAAPRARADRTWMANGRVHALVRAGNLLLIGGRFTKLLPPRGSRKEPVNVRNLAAIDLSTGKPVRSWRPRVPGTDATVHALAVSGGTVYVGGRFDRLAGTDVENLGAVRLSDGAAIAGFAPAIAGRVYTLLASPDRLYAGGAFGRVDGASRAKLAAWDLPSRDLSGEWRPRAVGGAVRDMTFDASESSIFIGGAFAEMAQSGSTFTRESVAKVAAQTGALRTWRIPDRRRRDARRPGGRSRRHGLGCTAGSDAVRTSRRRSSPAGPSARGTGASAWSATCRRSSSRRTAGASSSGGTSGSRNCSSTSVGAASAA